MYKVADLERVLSGVDEETIAISLGDITIADDAATISLGGGSDWFMLDEVAERALARYFSIPITYLAACPPEFRAQTLKFWQAENSDADTILEIVGGQLVSMHDPDMITIPVREVGLIMTKLFEPDDTVRAYMRDDKLFHLDITTTRHLIDVPNPHEMPGRPEVGDVTEGGVRVLVHPYSDKAPSVTSYLHRLVCTNGACTEERAGQIRLKGKTVTDILAEMETAAEEILGQLDEKMSKYVTTAEMPLPGSPTALAYQLGMELNLKRPVMDAIMGLANQLPSEASVYDIHQIFTSVANQVPHKNRMPLQTLGGALAFDAEHVLHRCTSCERLLPSAR